MHRITARAACSKSDPPWMWAVAGGAHGYFTKGRLIDNDNQVSFSDMLISCFHYMGFDDVTEFGDERLRLVGPLTGVTA